MRVLHPSLSRLVRLGPRNLAAPLPSGHPRGCDRAGWSVRTTAEGGRAGTVREPRPVGGVGTRAGATPPVALIHGAPARLRPDALARRSCACRWPAGAPGRRVCAGADRRPGHATAPRSVGPGAVHTGGEQVLRVSSGYDHGQLRTAPLHPARPGCRRHELPLAARPHGSLEPPTRLEPPACGPARAPRSRRSAAGPEQSGSLALRGRLCLSSAPDRWACGRITPALQGP